MWSNSRTDEKQTIAEASLFVSFFFDCFIDFFLFLFLSHLNFHVCHDGHWRVGLVSVACRQLSSAIVLQQCARCLCPSPEARRTAWHGWRPLSTSPSKCHLFGKSSGGQEPQTLDDVVSLLKGGDCKRVIVMAGAGISTPSGIPDFRSPGSGLYDNLQQYDIPYPEAIFDIHYFHQNPRPFFTLAKELYPGNYLPNSAHYFIRLLHMKGLLQRMYTQNIDGLERLAGVPPDKLVEAHGTFASATCTTCQKSYAGEDLKADIFADRVPKCATCRGVIKPDIVFFGEELPQRFLLFLTDFPLADLLIIMGTSLEVEPFASLAGSVRSSVTRVLINRDAVGPFASPSRRFNDVLELGDVIGGVEKCVDKLGWKAELDALMAAEMKKLKN